MLNWHSGAAGAVAARFTVWAPLVALAVTVLGTSASRLRATVGRCVGLALGATVQLQGCVVEGERRGTYTFSRVTAWPAAACPERHLRPAPFLAHPCGPAPAGQCRPDHSSHRHHRRHHGVRGIERNPGLSSRGGRRVAIELPEGDVITSSRAGGGGKVRSQQPHRHEDHVAEGASQLNVGRAAALPADVAVTYSPSTRN